MENETNVFVWSLEKTRLAYAERLYKTKGEKMNRKALSMMLVLTIMLSLFSVSSIPTFATASISLSGTNYQPYENVTVTLNDIPTDSSVWVGLIPGEITSDYDSHDIMYKWTRDLTNNQWNFKLPKAEGEYKVGVFVNSENDRMIAMSDLISSYHKDVLVSVNKESFKPSEEIIVNISAEPVADANAWIALIPADITSDYDSHDIMYKWVRDISNLTWSFNAPENEGSYKVGVFLKESSDQVVGMSSSFLISETSTPTTPIMITTVADLPELTFTDFNNTHWSYKYVQHMVSLGIITGYPDNTFRQDGAFSRSAFAKLLALSFDLPIYTGSNEIYTDIPNNHWAYGYIMSSNDYLTAYEKTDGTKIFLPNNDALREDVAVAMIKAMGIDPEDADMSYLEAYTDANEVSENLRNYVALAIEHGVMQGSDGYFNPKNVLTRAQACTLFSRFLTDIKDKDAGGVIKVTN